MSKNTYFTHYAKLSDTEELEIEVRYTLGTQHSFWGGKPWLRGLKVSLIPVERSVSGGFASKSFKLGDDRGRSFHVVSLKRKSDKQGNRLAEFVEQNIDDIAAAGVQQNWRGVADVLYQYECD